MIPFLQLLELCSILSHYWLQNLGLEISSFKVLRQSSSVLIVTSLASVKEY